MAVQVNVNVCLHLQMISVLLADVSFFCFLQVCGHICKCYSVAAQFEECREKMIELPNIIRDLCHILFYGKVRIMVVFC